MPQKNNRCRSGEETDLKALGGETDLNASGGETAYGGSPWAEADKASSATPSPAEGGGDVCPWQTPAPFRNAIFYGRKNRERYP
jgi:hypothetical protein